MPESPRPPSGSLTARRAQDSAGLPSVPGMTALVRIDDGGFCAVFRGRRSDTGRGVAVKILPAPFDRPGRALFDRERLRLRRLSDMVTVLQIDHVGELDDGRPFLVTELCAESCAQRVDLDGPLPPAGVAALGAEMGDALSAVHELGVVHGSVSPHNVLFRRSGQAVLADVGIAARAAYRGDVDYVGEYVAPETLRTGELDDASDVYGLGAMMFLAITGRAPFPSRIGEHNSERILRVLGEPAPRVSDDQAGPGLAALINEMLLTDPAERPTAREVSERCIALAPDNEPASRPELPAATASTTSGPALPAQPALPVPPVAPMVTPPATRSPWAVSSGAAPAAAAPSTAAAPSRGAARSTAAAPRGAAPASTDVPGEARTTDDVEPTSPPAASFDELATLAPPAADAGLSTDWSDLLDDVLWDTGAPEEPRQRVTGRPTWTEPAPREKAPDDEVDEVWHGEKSPRAQRSRSRSLAMLGGAALGGVALLVLVNTGGGGGNQAATPDAAAATQAPTSSTPSDDSVGGDVQPVSTPDVRLLTLTDNSRSVTLRWSGDADMEYAVVVRQPGQPATVTLVDRGKSADVPVVPGQPYCLQVQGTNGATLVTTPERGIRGASCK